MRPANMESTQVGRRGELVLEYANRRGSTVITNARCSSPWHFLPPLYLEETACATTFLMNSSGGLVGGDRLSLLAKLGKKTHVLVTTLSATKVYRSSSQTSIQNIDVTVGSGAILEWVPELTIPFAGSRFRQTITIRLHPGATVLLWDAIASGRIARKERWAFVSLENQITITTANGQSVIERYHLTPVHDEGDVGMAHAWNYVGSFYLVGDAIGSHTWKEIKENLMEHVDLWPGQVLGGISELAIPGIAVKLVAKSAPALDSVVQKLWKAARAQLWGLEPAIVRRY